MTNVILDLTLCESHSFCQNIIESWFDTNLGSSLLFLVSHHNSHRFERPVTYFKWWLMVLKFKFGFNQCCLSKYYTQVFLKLFHFVKSKFLCINVSISLIWLLIRSFSKYVAKFELKLIWNLKLSKQPLTALECFYYILQSNLVIKNGLIRNKLVLRNHLRGPIYQFTT